VVLHVMLECNVEIGENVAGSGSALRPTYDPSGSQNEPQSAPTTDRALSLAMLW
jgi:hypothetical protein